MSLRDFPLYLMETLKSRSSLHAYVVVFLFLTAVSKGSACEAPSSPECFRRNADESVYLCEWSTNTTETDVRFDLYFNKTKFRNIRETSCQINEEVLIKYRPVYIWVEAHTGNSSCTSTRRSVILGHTVKYEAPQNISTSWLKNNLNLSWTAAEKYPALAEIWFRPHENPTESWEKRTTNTTVCTLKHHVIVLNLLKNLAYEVQIRHRSTQALNPLWSDWSPVVTVPAELEQKPEVSITTRRLNGTRKVTLTWKPILHAAAVGGVKYFVKDTQSSLGCPCEKNRQHISTDKNKHTTYVSFSAVNISVTARNAAGFSPPAIIQVPAEPAADITICDKTLLNEKLSKTTCLEWYKLQDGESMPGNVITLAGRMKKKEREQIKMKIEDYVRYLYFEHRCEDGKPRTVKLCLFYKTEDVPLIKPQDFTAFGETQTSANLSWEAIPSAEQRGFLTHYSLCSVKISSQEEPKVCSNISASLTKYRVENLTPGTRYNISLAGVTRAGEGPEATLTFNTLLEKAVHVWWSLGLMIMFFFITTVCTCILKRIKNKIFPPVPTPVIPDLILYQPGTQDLLEKQEVVHEVTLHLIQPEVKSVPEDAEETTVLAGEWEDGNEEDSEHECSHSRKSEGSGDECLGSSSTDEALRGTKGGDITDVEQLEKEIATLIYRNGLVFDVKTDSP